jgi:hypothetical protein
MSDALTPRDVQGLAIFISAQGEWAIIPHHQRSTLLSYWPLRIINAFPHVFHLCEVKGSNNDSNLQRTAVMLFAPRRCFTTFHVKTPQECLVDPGAAED